MECLRRPPVDRMRLRPCRRPESSDWPAPAGRSAASSCLGGGISCVDHCWCRRSCRGGAPHWGHGRPSLSRGVPMRDGTPIACDLSRPATSGCRCRGPPRPDRRVHALRPGGGAVPVQQRGGLLRDARLQHADVPPEGNGPVGGTWQNAMSSQDGRDAADLVEWHAVQPFSDGRIGQFGASYGGSTP
jgi:hypothetical protein